MISDTHILSPLHQHHLHHNHALSSSSSHEEASPPSVTHTSCCSPSLSSSPQSLSMLEDFLAFQSLLVSPSSTQIHNPSTATHNLIQHYRYADGDHMANISSSISQNMLINNPSKPNSSYTFSFPLQHHHQPCNNLTSAANCSSLYPPTCLQHPCCDVILEDPNFLNGYLGMEHQKSLLDVYSDELAAKSHLTSDPGNPFLLHCVSEKECEPLSKKLCSSTRKGEEYNGLFGMDGKGSLNILIAQQNSNETCIEKARFMRRCASDRQCTAARNRRERIRARIKILGSLVPSGYKMDIVTMLDKAISYVKFLQMQIKVLTDDEYWPSVSKIEIAQSHMKPQINDTIQYEESITSTNVKECF